MEVEEISFKTHYFCSSCPGGQKAPRKCPLGTANELAAQVDITACQVSWWAGKESRQVGVVFSTSLHLLPHTLNHLISSFKPDFSVWFEIFWGKEMVFGFEFAQNKPCVHPRRQRAALPWFHLYSTDGKKYMLGTLWEFHELKSL